MKRIAVLTTLFMLALVSTSLGQITLKGRVIDAKSGKALIGANVRLIGTSIGIATDNKGELFYAVLYRTCVNIKNVVLLRHVLVRNLRSWR